MNLATDPRMTEEFALDQPLYLSLAINNAPLISKHQNIPLSAMPDKLLGIIESYIQSNYFLDGICLSGGNPLLDKRLSSLIDLILENDKYLSIDLPLYVVNQDLNSKILEKANQIRFFLPNLLAVKNSLEELFSSIQCLNVPGSKTLVVFLKDLNDYSICEEIAKLCYRDGFFLTIMYLNLGIKLPHRISDRDFWGLGENISNLIAHYPTMVCSEQPVWGVKFDNLEGQCPGLTSTLHVHYDSSIRICPFDPIQRAHLSMIEDWHALVAAWKKLPSLLDNRCFKCSGHNKCGGGCAIQAVCF